MVPGVLRGARVPGGVRKANTARFSAGRTGNVGFGRNFND